MNCKFKFVNPRVIVGFGSKQATARFFKVERAEFD
jgi:hypothetical protein